MSRGRAGLESEHLGVALKADCPEFEGVIWDSFCRFAPLGTFGGEFSSDHEPKFMGLDRALRCVPSARSFEEVDRRVSVFERGGRGVKNRLNFRGVMEGCRLSLL